jgi:hypothetical protein
MKTEEEERSHYTLDKIKKMNRKWHSLAFAGFL